MSSQYLTSRKVAAEVKEFLRLSTRTVSEIFAKFSDGFQTEEEFEKEILQPLKIDGAVEVSDFGIVSLTAESVKVLELNLAAKKKAETAESVRVMKLDLAAKKKAETVKSNLYIPRRDEYVPVELGKTCQRPGAYDFLKCPSLIGTKKVPHVSQNS